MSIRTGSAGPTPLLSWRSTCYCDTLNDFSVTIPRSYKNVYVNSLFPSTAKFLNFLPIECFPLTYDLNRFSSRINKYILFVGCFLAAFMYFLIIFHLFFL